MKSSLLLLAHYRYRVLIGIAVIAAMSLIVGVNDAAKNSTLSFLAVISFVAMAVMNLAGNFLKLVFPVSDRQIAYIPLAVWAVLFTVGVIAWGLGLAINARPGGVDLVVAVRMLLIAIVLLLFINRFLSTGANLMSFVWLAPLMFSIRDSGLPSWITRSVESRSGLITTVLVLGFLLREAPQNIRANRQLALNSQEPFFRIPIQCSKETIIAYSALILLVILITVRAFVPFTTETFIEIWPIGFLYLMLLGGGIALILHCWRLVRGSGFSGFPALWRLLVCLTGVGWPWRFCLGVRSGSVSDCKKCHAPRMDWMATCPHCEAAPVASEPVCESIDTEFVASEAGFGQVDGETFFYRWVIPCVLLYLLYANLVISAAE